MPNCTVVKRSCVGCGRTARPALVPAALAALLMIGPAVQGRLPQPATSPVREPVESTWPENLERETVAAALAAAEKLRSSYRMSMQEILDDDNGEFRSVGKVSRTATRLSAGDGRYRVQRSLTLSEETVVWNRQEVRIGQRPIAEPGESLHSLTIDEAQWASEGHDEIDATLGLYIRFRRSSRTPRRKPSEVVADTDVRVTISEIEYQGRRAIEVTMYGIWAGGAGPKLRYVYDPQKQWMLLYHERRSYGTLAARDADDEPGLIEHHRVTKSEVIDGIWMPTEKYWTADYVNSKTNDRDHYAQYVRFSDIELNPTFADEDFTISVDEVADGSFISDRRLGISYKKNSDNLIYMDGRLNEVRGPIRGEITPAMLTDLMKDAIPYIDPVAASSNLASVKEPGGWLKTAGFGFGALGLGLAGAGFWIWRRGRA